MDDTTQLAADLASAARDRHESAEGAERLALRLEELAHVLRDDPSWYTALTFATAEGLMVQLRQLANILQPIADSDPQRRK